MKRINALSPLAGILFLLIFVLVGKPSLALAESKKKYNTNIYEAAKNESISAKVKSTRESRGDTLVYFEGLKKSGPYILSETIKDYATLKNRLIKSSGVGGPSVSATIDEQDQILSVELTESAPKASP